MMAKTRVLCKAIELLFGAGFTAEEIEEILSANRDKV